MMGRFQIAVAEKPKIRPSPNLHVVISLSIPRPCISASAPSSSPRDPTQPSTPPPTHPIIDRPRHLRAQETSGLDRHKADVEPVDPKNHLEENCKPKCVKSLYDYERCVKRIENDGSGEKHCTGQYFDYWSCVDKCVAPKLFDKLK
ncbi:hypothetical protein ACP4OV_003189 [Aristida adscensionis]